MVTISRARLVALVVVLLTGCGSPRFEYSDEDGATGIGGAAGAAGTASVAGAAGSVGDAGGDSPAACQGSPNGWVGCEYFGCGVCAELIEGYTHYAENHPACVKIACQPGLYGHCNEACPAPTAADL